MARRSGVAGLGGQVPEIDAEVADRPLVFRVERVVEDQRRVARHVEPAVVLHLGFELPGGPAGVTQGKHRAVGPRSAGDGPQDVDGGGQRDAAVDRQGRIVDEEVVGVQHEAATRLDGAALQHLHRAGTARQFDRFFGIDDLELNQQVRKADLARGAVDDDTHRPFLGMGAEVDDGPREAFVDHAGHRDQHLPVEEATMLMGGTSFTAATVTVRHVRLAVLRSMHVILDVARVGRTVRSRFSHLRGLLMAGPERVRLRRR